jgi:Cu-processing system ATP-binding protein
MINLKNINKSYGKFHVLKSININIEKGQIIALMGPNGSGKTTLLKCILGLVIADSGEIKVDGVSIKNNFEYRHKIGYMPQTAYFPENIKVKDVIQIIKEIRGLNSAKDFELYDYFGIENFTDKKISSLSQGMKQKVSSALTFMFDSNILILDEPTAGLDPLSAEYMKLKIKKEKEKGKLIIITTHILNEVEELSDRMIYLLDGVVRADKVNDRLNTKIGAESILEKFTDLFKSYEWK